MDIKKIDYSWMRDDQQKRFTESFIALLESKQDDFEQFTHDYLDKVNAE